MQVFLQKKYVMATRPGELNIAGVRSRETKPNTFNDTIHVFYKREDGEWIHNAFAATTDPGTYWLQSPMNVKGTAILCPGQYIHSHRIGVHRGKYQALVQQNTLTVYRDNNRDSLLDYHISKKDSGIFGINIHRANSKGTTRLVEKHSAGCQVLADVEDFNLLMTLAMRHKKLYGNHFTYTLLTEDELFPLAAAA